MKNKKKILEEIQKMTWNYRVLAHQDGDGTYFQIHEVYYDEQGNPNGYTERGTTMGSETLESLRSELERMRECLSKPVLSYSDFPNEFKETITPKKNEK
jgi:hypothetical protein